ncbi:MAG TPA: J domain-containing protein [Enterobacteriaceae bacterium]|nr:J domain-containing protein [Enterobacteriaceae bacterium]
MSIWQTLDIAPTRDTAEIRRAYARRLKECRPDRDPTGYQALREAFDEAKQWASNDLVFVDDETLLTPELSGPDEVVALSPLEPVETLPETAVFYTDSDIQALASQLVATEMTGIIRLTQLWSRVADRGSLWQQQRFHQDLAAALAEQPGLTEGLLERVAGMLEWRLEDYDNSHIIPQHIQYALQNQLRETELARARRQMDIDEKHGSILSRIALRLVRSERQTVPFWLRLVPGAITRLSRQVNEILYYYPEMASELNPTMLAFLQQPRMALNWQGIFLLGFWCLVFNGALKISDVSAVVGTIAVATVLFYLYVSDMIMLGLQSRPRLLRGFMVTECIFSVIVILLCCGGLMGAAALSVPATGHGPLAVVGLIYMLVVMIVFWAAWPKDVPLIRKPGIVMSRIFSSPWKLMVWLNFAWFSLLWIVIYCVLCTVILVELLKLFSGI